MDSKILRQGLAGSSGIFFDRSRHVESIVLLQRKNSYLMFLKSGCYGNTRNNELHSKIY